jgi:hypothetical protein
MPAMQGMVAIALRRSTGAPAVCAPNARHAGHDRPANAGHGLALPCIAGDHSGSPLRHGASLIRHPKIIRHTCEDEAL